MVRLVAGGKGSGKSYACVRDMLALAAQDRRKPICTNLALTDVGRERIGRQRLIELADDQVKRWWEFTPKGSATFLDEASVHFDANEAMKIMKENKGFATYLQHIRHERDDLWIITQKWKHVVTRIRELADVFTWCVSSKVGLSVMGMWHPALPEFFVTRDYLSPDADEVDNWRILRLHRSVFECYDSYSMSTASKVKRLDWVLPEEEEEVVTSSKRRGLAKAVAGIGMGAAGMGCAYYWAGVMEWL